MKKKFCERCGKELSAGDQFCTECGYKVNQNEKGKTAAVRKRKSKKLILVIGIALVVVILIIGNKEDSNKSEVPEKMEQMIAYEESGALENEIEGDVSTNELVGDGYKTAYKMTLEEFCNLYEEETKRYIDEDKDSWGTISLLVPLIFSDEDLIDAGVDESENIHVYWVNSSSQHSMIKIAVNLENSYIHEIQYYKTSAEDSDNICLNMISNILGCDFSDLYTAAYDSTSLTTWDNGTMFRLIDASGIFNFENALCFAFIPASEAYYSEWVENYLEIYSE